MTVLARYLNRMFLQRFAVVLFAIVGFAAVLDLIDVADQFARQPEGAVASGLRYFGLRLPIMLSELMPIAALVAGLLAVADLMRHRELVVMWSSGVRPITLLKLLIPAGLLLVGAKFVIDDVALPWASTELRLWGIGEYRHHVADGQAGDYYWLRTGDDIVRVSANAASAGELRDITLFRRDAAGLLLERLDAAQATELQGTWRLEDVTRAVVATRRIERLPSYDWPGAIDLERVKLMARPPRELELRQLQEIAAAGGYGMRAREPYVTWLHLRLAGALGPMLLMMLAFALVRRFSRTASIAPVFMTAVAIGFTLIIVGGVASALGEVGVLPPVLAAWVPTVALTVVVLLLAARGSWARLRPGRTAA